MPESLLIAREKKSKRNATIETYKLSKHTNKWKIRKNKMVTYSYFPTS